MEFEQIVRKRYATKRFDGKKLPDEKVKKLFELIRHAPTSFNLQPYAVKVVTDPAIKKKLAPASWNQPQIESCSHLLVFCANTDVESLITKLEKESIAAGANPESIKGYVQMMRGFAEGLQDHKRLAWAQKQAYIALGNALNGATALGFDSCPMEGFDAKQYSDILLLPKNLVPTVLCPIGFADPADKPHPKLRFAQRDLFLA